MVEPPRSRRTHDGPNPHGQGDAVGELIVPLVPDVRSVSLIDQSFKMSSFDH